MSPSRLPLKILMIGLGKKDILRKSRFVESRGRHMDIWKLRPGRKENHLWDTAVMGAVAASISGVALESHFVAKPKKITLLDPSEIQKSNANTKRRNRR